MQDRPSKCLSPRGGFTLVELLVVIAIIGVLAALLLPVLGRAKDSAKSAACKNNLRQIGITLSLYVDEYGKYGGTTAAFLAGEFYGFEQSGLLWLKAYNLSRYRSVTEQGLPSYDVRYAGDRSIFNCPAWEPELLKGLSGAPSSVLYPEGYAYNALGTGWKAAPPSLGLGPVVQLKANMFGEVHRGQIAEVGEAAVRLPADMIAIGDSEHDGVNSLSPLPNRILDQTRSAWVGSIHRGGGNVVFCDGHIQYGKQQQWTAESDSVRKKWNNDNQPHRETW